MKARLTKLFTLLTVLLFGVGSVWGDATITLADVTPSSNWYEVTGVGRVTNKKGNAFSDGDYNCTGTGYKTGSSYFTVQTYMAITGLQITATSTSNRTVNGIAIGDAGASSAPSSFPDGASASGSIAKNTCDQVVTINFGTTVAANKYISIGLSGNANIFAVTFIAASVTKHTVTYDLNGGTGTLPTQADVAEGAKFTLHNGTTGITAPANKDFDGWHDGTTKYAGGAEYTMGTSNVILTAQWKNHVANYTVIYKDGTTELGSETVEVGHHPTGSEIAAPTKDCYTFAGWDPALNTVSGSDGDEVVVNATWTPLYASSFNFGTTTDLTKDNIATKLATSNIFCSVGTGGSYDDGGTTGYLGYKFKNNGDYVTFIVQNGYEAIVTYGYTESGWQVNGADAGVAVKTKAYVDKKYQANGSDLLLKLVNQSANSKTSVLTNIVIKATATGEDDATLSDLSVSGYTLNPSFDSATEDYTITKEYGAADPVVGDVTATPSVTGADADIAWDGTNHKFVITVTAKDGVTEKTYNITINEAEAKRGLLTVPFSNGAKGAINAAGLEIRVPYIGASEPTVVLANIEYQSGVSGASASMESDKLRITGADSNYDDYTLTFVQLTPSALTLDEEVTFDAVPSYAFAPYGWDSGKGVKFARSVEEASNHRVSLGNTRVYFAIQACDEVQLTSGSGGARDVKIYVNGVLSSVTKTAASGSAIKLALDNMQPNFIAIESNQTSGDGGFTKIRVKALAANTLAYTDGAYTTGDAALDLSTLISTSNSDAAITYTVTTDGGTNATITGNNFAATAAGTAVITATQAASETVRQASVDFNVVVTAGATKYTVTFDSQGGSAVDPQEVKEGESPEEPTAPTKDEYIFKGWAESAGASVSDVVDVTSFTINAPKIFYAVWEAEPAGIKLVNGDGSINTTNFTTGATASTVNFGGEDHNCAVFGSTGGSIVGLTGLNKVVAYNATTTQTKVKFVLYNTNSSAKELYLQKVLEGATEAVTETIAVPSKERFETVYYTYNSSDLRSFYVTVNSTNIRILQMKVIEDGTILKRAGEAGYELNLNKGRVFGAQGVETAFEGLIVTPSSNAKVLNSTELPITTPLSFSIAEPLTLKVTTSAAKYYVSQNSAEDGTTATAITTAGEETFDLTVAGTWYIVPSTTSAVKLTNIAFSAPRVDRTITFDSNGGSSVADIVVKDGEVATAPTDPTKDDNDFAGWYNGSDLYDWTAPVTSDLNLTAHWTAHVNNDATLKSLSYGSTAITLEDGVLTYNVNLPALTLAVPALTAEPNAALATADVTDAADFDGDGKATSSVLVTAEDGTTQLTYTVNFTKAALLPQVNVTANTIWDWANIASENITLVGGLKNYECVLANVEGVTNDATFNSQALLFCGERVRSVESSRTFASIGHISFNVTVPGKVTVEFSDNGNNNRRIKINDEQSDASSSKTDVKTFEANVAAGTVTIMGISNDGSSTNQYVRISRIEFEVASAPTPETVRTGLEVGRYYTICLPKKVVAATGATFWSMSERNTDTENPLAYIVEENLPLTAGQPFLFQATATTLEVTYEGEATTAGSHGALHGTLNAMDQDALDAAAGANKLYILKNNELRLASGRTGNSLAANRAYIIYEELDPVSTPSHAPGRQVRSMPLHKDVATGLDDLNADTQAQKVILNGQLFIIRGEKMYDATGILVK